ncbi:ABC transporter permease [Patescibacteria group bacterium]
MLADFFKLTLKGVLHRPLRSWLTIVGIVIGIMLVVFILALGSGIRNTVNEMLQQFGSDLIVIFPGKENNPLVGLLGNQRFRDRDVADLKNIDGVRLVVPMDVGMLNLEYEGDKKTTMVHGAPWNEFQVIFEESQGVNLYLGDWPADDRDREVVFGYLAAKSLFNREIDVGDEVIVKSRRLKVAGILSEIGNQSDDNTIYLSLDLFRNITGESGGVRSIMIKIDPKKDTNLLAKQIEHQLSKQEVVRDFVVLTPEKTDRLAGGILTLIEFVLIALAFMSLLVGSVGIMNTMYTSVLERTRQIGVMKAIGASDDEILSLFLIESGTIGLIGGLLGIILGISLAFFTGFVAKSYGIDGLFSFASLDYLGIFVVLIITFITGILAGILPARTASKMEPADALRYE